MDILSPEILVLLASAAGIACVHTLLGPDHYLPFVSMAVARRWSWRRLLGITAVCGAGHLLGSLALGMVGIWAQAELAALAVVEGWRADLAAWALLSVGLVYFAWGLRQAQRGKQHEHWHHHGETLHRHTHTHQDQHLHVHEAGQKSSLTPWLVFVIFVLGPCEPLIPLLMYPAAKASMVGVFMVAAVFGLVTVLSMLLAVTVSFYGLRKLKLDRMERFGHAMAGATLAACGASITFLGL
jgi:nickel/cobalt exporter